MNRYKILQIISSVSVAVLIVSLSLALTMMNRGIYKLCLNDWYEDMQDLPAESEYEGLDKARTALCYETLADRVTKIKEQNSFSVPDYDILPENEEKLAELNGVYRTSMRAVLISAVITIYCFIRLARRRQYNPLGYGAALATLLVSLEALYVMFSEAALPKGIRDMILYRDYGYFAKGDVIRLIIPPDFARWLFVGYILFVLLVLTAFVLIKLFTYLNGKPYEF